MHTTISHSVIKKERKSQKLNLIQRINRLVEKEKSNSIGISIALIMFGTGIASITAALAVDNNSFFILMLATAAAMGANVTAISQRSFKTISWAFIINISLNILLIAYQLIF